MSEETPEPSRRLRERQGFETAFRSVREALESRGKGDGLEPALAGELRAALAEMDVMWDEIEAQSRLISRDRRRYARFFQHMPDACVVTTAAGRISETNRAAVNLLGVPGAKLPGRALATFLADEDRAQFGARLIAIDRDGRDGGPWRATLRPAAGRPVPVALNLRAVQHASGEIGELCWMIRPID